MPTAPNLGFQRIDSTTPSLPLWGMGSLTRDGREVVHVAKGRLFSNNLPSRYLLGGSIDPLPEAAPAAAPPAVAPPAEAPPRKQLGRALAVAMAAEQAGSDPVLAAALSTLHSRVATLRASGGSTKDLSK